MATPDLGFLETDVVSAAKRLLGCELVSNRNGQTLRGRIIEVEAYDQYDVGSHSYRGKTPRNSVMFGASGHLYVYFTYGMHYCCNVVVGPPGHAAAVLIRAVEPLEGQDIMLERRNGRGGAELTNGPAKVCQAFAIDTSLNGHDLQASPVRLIPGEPVPESAITTTTRIGLSRGQDVPWRFVIDA